MKRQIYIFFLISCFIILFYENVQAGILIWQIGESNDAFSEFAFPDANIIEYTVPRNWESLLDPNGPNYGNWGDFPKFLYPSGDYGDIPQEIRIDFDYFEDYSIAILNISARTESEDPNIRLRIFKGEIFIGENYIGSSDFSLYDFYVGPIGPIKEDSPEKNKIIIKSSSSFNTPVYFDYISLFSNDTDGDGVSDTDEGDCSLDKATTCIPIKTSDPDSSIIKIIKLHIIDESEGAIPGFREMKFLDPNALYLPEQLKNSRLFPYGFLGFKVEEIMPNDKIAVQISIMDQEKDQPDKFYPSVRFYSYQDSNSWHETNFELLDENTARISLYDSGEGDFDGEKDGIINSKIAISYPRTIDVDVEKRGCFINTVIIYGKNHGEDP